MPETPERTDPAPAERDAPRRKGDKERAPEPRRSHDDEPSGTFRIPRF